MVNADRPEMGHSRPSFAALAPADVGYAFNSRQNIALSRNDAMGHHRTFDCVALNDAEGHKRSS